MIKKILIILLIFTSSVYAEVVKEIKIEGNNRISSETIKVYGEINLNSDYSNIDINNILKNLYSTNFFENIDLNFENGVLTINVKEYAVINSISIDGETSKFIKESILKKLQMKPKESFIPSELNNDVILLKKIYASLGYNFAEVNTKVEKFSENRVNLLYQVDKGNITYIKKINFIGDKKFGDNKLASIIVSEEKKFWKILSKNTFFKEDNIDLDKRLLLNYYRSLGYYDAQVLSESAEVNKSSSELTYTINAGNRYSIKKISTNVDNILNKEIFLPLEKNFTKLIGKYYSPFKLKNLLDNVELLIAKNDLQFVEHSVSETLDGDFIEIQINIYEGKKDLVEKINIKGNTVTDETVIRAELLLDEGDPYNQLKLDQSVSNLKARNLFGEINTKVFEGSKKDLKILEISVEEKPTGEISAGAGIGTSGGNFIFNISENNFLGKGIKISSNLDISSQTFSGGLYLSDPNYNFSGNELTYFISNTKNDKPESGFENNIFSLGVGTKFEQYEDVYLSPNLLFSYDDLKVDNSASLALKRQKGTFSDISLDYSIISDKRDRSYGPTDGYITSFNQTFPFYADSPFIKNSFSLSKYQSFTPSIIGSFKLYGAAITGLNNEDVRISKRLNLNSSRLRGFELGKIGPKDGSDYVGGNYAASSSFEINLPNLLPESTKTDVGLFLDFGNVWNVDYNDAIDDSNKIRSSFGLNTNWLSPIGPMSFVFSQNLSKASTDVTESFNFRLGTSF